MAEERTEAATPKRHEEIRKQGQTPRSHDLTTVAVLLAALYGLKITVATLWGRLSDLLVGSIQAIAAVGPTAPAGADKAPSAIAVVIAILPPMLGLMAVAALAVSVLQGGFTFVPGLLTPKWDRINPIAGTKRIVSTQSLVQLGLSLGKITVISIVAASVIRSRLAAIAGVGALELWPALMVVMNLLWEIALKSALAMVALALIDWVWQRRRYLNASRMTKQEVAEEHRQTEGDPHIRAQFRQRRAQFLQQMMKDVRTADVVVTNPTHFAVALRYDPTTMSAPVVIAKGQDHLALRIRATASEAGAPVLENPPLARALYKLVPVGKAVPPELYVAVAEVLAFIFRLRAEQQRAA